VTGDESFSCVWVNTILEYDSVSRKTEYTITDLGRFTNSCDYLELENFTDFNYDFWYNTARYRKIDIIITMDVREVNDGYQGILIYNGTSTSSTYITGEEFEYGSKSYDDPKTCTFSNLNLSSFSTDIICVRYGARGSGADTWKNKNCSITIRLHN